MKRLFDILASGLGLVVLGPLFLLLAIWINLDSFDPVFIDKLEWGVFIAPLYICLYQNKESQSFH